MASQTQLLVIEAPFLPRIFGLHPATSMESNKGSPLPSTLKLMARLKGRTALWRPTSELLLISSKMIGPNSYQWLNSPRIMQRILAPIIRLSNSTASTTSEPSTKKLSILALSQNQQIN